MTKMTQNQKLIRRLSNGKNLTITEAQSRYGVKNLSARVAELREFGFAIYTNRFTAKGGVNRGKTVTGYRLSVEKTPNTLLNDGYWFSK